ncbi:MAG TPA: hypothetical protein HA257_07195, partial [Candidatus Methanoperedenaceae archaeon]|nr:hypothetical protein [Candidatus Methanoperedenaceae archaeon]
PLPAQRKSEIAGKEMASESEEVAHEMSGKMLAQMSAHLNLEPKRLAGLDFGRYIGPFWRCRTWIVPEWYPIFDVPDITFRVTQDVDGDGDEEVIYSESFFDVRWNSGPIPDVKLEASQIALAGVACETPDDIPCENVPAILFVGLMPLVNPAIPYHDAASGYARRPNRPHASGNIAPIPTDFPPPPSPPILAQTPYTGTLQLYGCNNIDDADYYRLTYSFNGGATVPFTGLTWPLYRVVGGALQTQWTAPDANGWYPIIPDSDGWFPSHLLLNWPTGGFQNGLYETKLELGNAAKAVIDSSAPVGFRIDNSYPAAQFTGVRWRKVGDVWHDMNPYFCPVIRRPVSGGVPADIEIEVSILASASHLRSTELNSRGCSGTTPTRITALNTAQHWHTSAADNTFISTAVFSLPGTAPQGAYGFDIHAVGRAFNPAGGDGGFEADWYYDPDKYRYVWPSISIAVVNL